MKGPVNVAVTTPHGTATAINAYTYIDDTNSDFASGDGTAGNPYVIANAEQLDKVRNYLDSHFVLNGNLDMDVTSYNTGSGWVPIGTTSSPFTGTFDGNGKEINGLFINSGTSIGLFGTITANAKISDLTLQRATINASGSNVGILVGYMQGGTIRDCYVEGRVTSSNGSFYTGGLVGRMGSEATITSSHANVDVFGYSGVGGLVGVNDGSIQQSYSEGSVGGNFTQIGGLVGENFGTVNQAYSLAQITSGSTKTGGLIGDNKGSVIETYAAGEVMGSAQDTGGLIGVSSGSVLKSYYDTETTTMNDTGKGLPLTTVEMKNKNLFLNWDFDSVWQIDFDEYPSLR